LKNDVTTGDDDWGLENDEATGNVRLSKELSKRKRGSELEKIPVSTESRHESEKTNGERSPSHAVHTDDMPPSVEFDDSKPMKSSNVDMTPIKGKDGWSKYKSTNLSTDDKDLDEDNNAMIINNDERSLTGELEMRNTADGEQLRASNSSPKKDNQTVASKLFNTDNDMDSESGKHLI
jgi:hypothetical protein